MCIISLATATSIATALGTALASAASAVAGAVGTAGAAIGSAAGMVGGAASSIGSLAATGASTLGSTVASAASSVAGWAGTTAFTVGGINVTNGGLVAGGISATNALASGIIGTVSGVQSANANAAYAEQMGAASQYQAELEAANARRENLLAANVEKQGDQERLQLRLNMLDQLGKGRAAYGAAGVVLGSGSPADFEADVADAYDLDRRNLDYDIANRAYQHRMGAYNSTIQSGLLRQQSEQYGDQADNFRTQAATSLVGGIFDTVSDTVKSGVTGALAGSYSPLTKAGGASPFSKLDKFSGPFGFNFA